LTQIHRSFEGDVFFPKIDLSDWIEVSRRTGNANDSSTPYFEQLVDEALEAARQTEERPVFNVVKPTRPL